MRKRTELSAYQAEHYPDNEDLKSRQRVYQQRQEVDVNRDRLEGRWKQFSRRVRVRWGRLTDNQLSMTAGKHDQAAGRYQEQYGITREEGERALTEFLHLNRDGDSSRR